MSEVMMYVVMVFICGCLGVAIITILVELLNNQNHKGKLPEQLSIPKMPNVKPPKEEPNIMEFMRKKR